MQNKHGLARHWFSPPASWINSIVEGRSGAVVLGDQDVPLAAASTFTVRLPAAPA